MGNRQAKKAAREARKATHHHPSHPMNEPAKAVKHSAQEINFQVSASKVTPDLL